MQSDLNIPGQLGGVSWQNSGLAEACASVLFVREHQRGFGQGVRALNVWPTAGLTTGLAHPDPHNLWTCSLPFQDLSIYAQPSTLWPVIYSFLLQREKIYCKAFCFAPAAPPSLLVYPHFSLFILHSLSLSCIQCQYKFPSFTSLLSPSFFAPLISLPLTTPLSFIPSVFTEGDQWSLKAFLLASLLSCSDMGSSSLS